MLEGRTGNLGLFAFSPTQMEEQISRVCQCKLIAFASFTLGF